MNDELDYDNEITDVIKQTDKILNYLISFLENKRKIGVGHGLLSEYEHLLTKDIIDCKREYQNELDKNGPNQERLKKLSEYIDEKSNLLREVKEVRNEIRREGADRDVVRHRMKSCLEDCMVHYGKEPNQSYDGFLQSTSKLNTATHLYLGCPPKLQEYTIDNTKLVDKNKDLWEHKGKNIIGKSYYSTGKNNAGNVLDPELESLIKDDSLSGDILPPTETTIATYNKFNDVDIEVIYNAKFCLEKTKDRLLEDNRFTNIKGHIEVTPIISGPSAGLVLGLADYNSKVNELHSLIEIAKERHNQKLLSYPNPKLLTVKGNLSKSLGKGTLIEATESKEKKNLTPGLSY